MKKVFAKVKSGDLTAYIAVALAAALLPFLLSSKNANNVKIVCGDDIYLYSLTENRRIELENNGITLTAVIENGRVYVENSTCRDGICEHTPPLHSTGSIVCLPAEVIITLTAEGYDYAAG